MIRTGLFGFRELARDSSLNEAIIGDVLVQIVVNALDLVRSSTRMSLQFALTILLGPADLKTLGYQDR